MVLWTLIVIASFVVLSFKVYQKFTSGICRSSAHMMGKVVLITEGNSGIGLETVKDLASRGARILIACPSVERSNAAKREIIAFSNNKDVHCYQLDLSSLRSVRECSQQIIKNEKRLDVFINNAGAGELGNGRTEDGLHIGMQVNYFAPFLFTCLLLPLMKSSAPSRIINISAMIHYFAEMDFENLNMEKSWSESLVYANSKLFLNLMTLELGKRLEGTGVTVNALDPGITSTNILRNILNPAIRNVVSYGIGFLFQTPWEAAQTTIFLAVSPEVATVSGKYFKNCCETKPSQLSLDSDIAKKLFEESRKLVKYKLHAE